MTARDDLRALSLIDTRHHALRLSDASDGWYERSKFKTLSVQARNGTPLVGVNLRYPAPCPVDATADMHIVHWLTNFNADKRALRRAFVRIITAIHAHMVDVGATRVWGVIGENNTHLTELLAPLLAAGVGERIPIEAEKAWFYVGGRDVDAFMRGLR